MQLGLDKCQWHEDDYLNQLSTFCKSLNSVNHLVNGFVQSYKVCNKSIGKISVTNIYFENISFKKLMHNFFWNQASTNDSSIKMIT